MRTRKTSVVIVVIITTLVLTMSGFEAVAQDRGRGMNEAPTGEAMAADLVLLRPLAFAATAIGSVLFVASLPFSATGGNAKGALDRLVGEPAAFTFARPLGKVDY